MNFKLLNKAHSVIDNHIDTVKIVAPPQTDYFSDITGNYRQFNAPLYYITLEGDFIFRCKVKPEFKETYDAGGIIAYGSDAKWMKYAFENTDLGYPSVVSVITSTVSDDCNGEMINNNEIWMQIVRKDNNWCFHYSDDKITWKMTRYFRFELPQSIFIGVFSQSPIGEGCKVIFSEIEVLKQIYNSIRKAE